MPSQPFGDIPEGKLETLNALQAAYVNDVSPQKADLMVGVYRDDDGQSFVLPSVKLARQRIFENPNWNHEYPSSHLGTKKFRDLAVSLFFGDHDALANERIAAMQCLGASGACHMGALFLKLHYGPFQGQPGNIYMPAETWAAANHPNVFNYVGLKAMPLPWYSPKSQMFDLNAFLSYVKDIPPRSVIVLQVSCNNPTGCDASPAEWEAIVEVFVSEGHCAFLDAAYPGFATGDVEKDCAPIRQFRDANVPLLVAATFGKAFGLYGERVGLLCVTAPDRDTVGRMETQMKLLARAETGAQPAFGATIVQTILDDAELRGVWRNDVIHMADQLKERREKLLEELRRLESPGDWGFITKQVGMFCYTGFNAEQIELLREKHHVYLQDTGRLSVAGLNSSNIEYVARSIDFCMRGL
ncbi:hypothetical protein ARSEF1564_007269 [Beauveria bassiana]